jgi:hypothetical protein
MGNVVCPVCVVGGIGFILSRIFGFPDVVVSIITGMLATSTAYWMNQIISKRWKKRKGQLVALNILSGIVCLYSLKLIGFGMKVHEDISFMCSPLHLFP